jgi:hypothetical protein
LDITVLRKERAHILNGIAIRLLKFRLSIKDQKKLNK